MPDRTPNTDRLTRLASATIVRARLHRLHDVETTSNETQAVKVGSERIRLLLVLCDTACGTTAVYPHAELLVKDLLMRVAIAIENDTGSRANAANLSLDQGDIVVGGRQTEGCGREKEQAEEGEQHVDDGRLHCEAAEVYSVVMTGVLRLLQSLSKVSTEHVVRRLGSWYA